MSKRVTAANARYSSKRLPNFFFKRFPKLKFPAKPAYYDMYAGRSCNAMIIFFCAIYYDLVLFSQNTSFRLHATSY